MSKTWRGVVLSSALLLLPLPTFAESSCPAHIEEIPNFIQGFTSVSDLSASGAYSVAFVVPSPRDFKNLDRCGGHGCHPNGAVDWPGNYLRVIVTDPSFTFEHRLRVRMSATASASRSVLAHGGFADAIATIGDSRGVTVIADAYHDGGTASASTDFFFWYGQNHDGEYIYYVVGAKVGGVDPGDGGEASASLSVTFSFPDFPECNVKPAATMTLLDPAPGLLESGIVRAAETLPKTGGTPVDGVATDGVAQVVVRIEGQPSTTYQLALDGDPSLVGAVTLPASTEYASQVDVVTDENGFGFGVYRAPSIHGADAGRLTLSESARQVASRELQLVKPLIVVYPGLGGLENPLRYTDLWRNAAAEGWDMRVVTHGYGRSETLSRAAAAALQGTTAALRRFKQDHSVAAARVDVIAYSAGGLVARRVARLDNYVGPLTYEGPIVRKLIEIGVPKLGSLLLTRVATSSLFCALLFSRNSDLRQLADDLRVGSETLRDLGTAQFSESYSVAGVQSPAQARSTEQRWRTLLSGAINVACPALEKGFAGVFGALPNDQVVDVISATAFSTSDRVLRSGRLHVADFSDLVEYGPDLMERVVLPSRKIGAAPDDSLSPLLEQWLTR